MQKDVADLAGINVFTYSGYENARALPPVDCLLRIAEIYGVSLDFITGRVDTVRTMVGENTDSDDDETNIRLAHIEKVLRDNGLDL
jgi:transcriptional regulator with XRE-family HTH domain